MMTLMAIDYVRDGKLGGPNHSSRNSRDIWMVDTRSCIQPIRHPPARRHSTRHRSRRNGGDGRWACYNEVYLKSASGGFFCVLNNPDKESRLWVLSAKLLSETSSVQGALEQVSESCHGINAAYPNQRSISSSPLRANVVVIGEVDR